MAGTRIWQSGDEETRSEHMEAGMSFNNGCITDRVQVSQVFLYFVDLPSFFQVIWVSGGQEDAQTQYTESGDAPDR